MSKDADSDKRERTQALALAKECYAMKLDLLSSATIVQIAVDFVDRNLTMRSLGMVLDITYGKVIYIKHFFMWLHNCRIGDPTDVRGGIVSLSGHWIPKERPDFLIKELVKFFDE